jgi:hypothetical protein
MAAAGAALRAFRTEIRVRGSDGKDVLMGAKDLADLCGSAALCGDCARMRPTADCITGAPEASSDSNPSAKPAPEGLDVGVSAELTGPGRIRLPGACTACAAAIGMLEKKSS